MGQSTSNLTCASFINTSQSVLRIWCKFSLASPLWPLIIGSGKLCQKLEPKQNFSIWNVKSQNTSEHFLFVCGSFAATRRRLIYPPLATILQEPPETSTSTLLLQRSTASSRTSLQNYTSSPHLQPITPMDFPRLQHLNIIFNLQRLQHSKFHTNFPSWDLHHCVVNVLQLQFFSPKTKQQKRYFKVELIQ